MIDDRPDGDAEKPGRGSGSGSVSAPNTRDVRLLAMALEERWPMSAEAREAAIRRLEEVVANPNSRPRAFHAALKALMALSRVNLSSVDVAIRARASEELEARIGELERRIAEREGG